MRLIEVEYVDGTRDRFGADPEATLPDLGDSPWLTVHNIDDGTPYAETRIKLSEVRRVTVFDELEYREVPGA